MSRPAPLRPADLRGALRLATEATAGLADLVEAMHERIARVPGFGTASPDGRTRGLTGLVYRTIRGTTRVVGGGLDALIGRLAPALATDASPPAREALVAALNGVLGDHLAATGNPLAITMALRHEGRPLVLDATALAERLPQAGGRLLVLLHGLCLNDRQWSRAGHDHGAALARELRLHAADPALQQRPACLDQRPCAGAAARAAARRNGHSRCSAWCCSATAWAACSRAARSMPACRTVIAGRRAWATWCSSARRTTARRWSAAGHGVDRLLAATPYTAPLARLGRLRSAGITDLRHGNLLDEDWVGHDRFAHADDTRLPVPLPAGVRCFALAGCLGKSSATLKARLLGDGLVPLDSALGRHPDPARTLAFPADRQWIAQGVGHLELLGSAAVTAQLRRWLG